MKIIIDNTSKYIEDVIRLSDSNKDRLGLLPRGAFFALAAQNRILVALDKNNKFSGYLLYGVNKRDGLLSITHLCVKKSERGKGFAEALFKEFLKTTQASSYKGIRVRCRFEYEANKVWPRLGFKARDEMVGKSKDGSILIVWWYDYGHETLFSFANKQRTKSKLNVAVDANIFYQLQEPPSSSNTESQALLADWLTENIELCLTVEIFNEIIRNKNEDEREKKRIFANSFMELPTKPDDGFESICKKLHSYFHDNMSESDESDLRHLARTIASDTRFFITQDKDLLKKTEEIYNNFKLRIIRPSDLIIHQDALIREDEYQPARLSGSSIKIERLNSEQISFLENTFRLPQKETKPEFRQKIAPFLASPHTFQTDTIKDNGQVLALRIYDRSNSNELSIPLLRVLPGNLSTVLARHIIFQAILTSNEEGRIFTKFTDKYLSDDVINALYENGFIYTNEFWIKANFPFAGTCEELSLKIESLSQYDCFQKISKVIKQNDLNANNLLNIEQALFPAKITDINIPAFIVPIKAFWAMNLFDKGIASQDMFGGDPGLMLNIENVYYKSAKQKILSAPGRILWYVSKSKTYYKTMSIRACSYLDEVIIDKPKNLFLRYQGLGVFQWKDVLETAGGDINNEIMAFRFSNTEVFQNPVKLHDLRKIWSEEDNKNIHLQSPISISNQRFFDIYKSGNQIL